MTGVTTATACARAGVAGNPSDGYGGAVLAIPIPTFRASVTIGLGEPVSLPLIAAALSVWRDAIGPLPGAGQRVTWSSTIPMTVGLAGSSAIVVATLRAVARATGTDVHPVELATLALRAERDELGIAAGWQDRVAQAYEAPVLVEGGDRDTPPKVTELRPTSIPLFVAWTDAGAAPSPTLHAPLRDRYDVGERAVHDAMDELAAIGRRAAAAYGEDDIDTLGNAIDATAMVREGIGALTVPTRSLIEAARAVGAHATSAGSGGAIVGVTADVRRVVAAMEHTGAHATVLDP